MVHLIFTICVIAGVLAVGVTGVYQFSNAESQSTFVCNANVQNGHVNCSSFPKMGDHGLFILDSQNSCPIDVSFTIENRMVVEIRDHSDCRYNDGFKLALTVDA